MTSESTAKKDIQKLQRAIVDGLEDVKGQDIVVFNTEHMSPLFERVIVASGTSNRQTRALAASVRDAVRDAGFDKPRIEGEDNGEWIIVDCGQAVAHVMQPVIRQYYRLEEIWGQKPVRLKHGAPKPVKTEAAPAAKKTSRKKAASAEAAKTVKPIDAKSVARKAAKAAKAPAVAPVKTAAKTTTKVAAKTPARKTTAGAVPAKKAIKTVVVKPKSATRPAAKSAGKPATRTAPKKKA